MSSGEFHDRVRKRDELRVLGIHPYPSRFEGGQSTSSAHEEGQKKKPRTIEEILKKGPTRKITLRGRLMTFREHGRLSFANLKDQSGKIQICFMEEVLGKDTYKLLRKLDMGDFLGASGELFITKHGELTLLVAEFTLLSKALRPLPEKWHGIQDQESIYRQRYLDLLMNEESFQRFILRSKLIEHIRQFLNRNGFLEIETPVLSTKASGATARPFQTHHNALDLDVYLRIAPELFLKRAVVGGFERVYEFARCFRNEGMDPSHLQEFNMLEYYVAYWNFEDNMRFTEELIVDTVKTLFGTLKIKVLSREGESLEVDFKAPWQKKEFGELIKKDCGIDIYEHYDDADSLRKAIQKKKIVVEDAANMGYGNLCDALYKKVSRPKLIQPTFVTHHPASTKPLARRSDKDPRKCETFQLLLNGWEIVNAYSEIVDPEDQRSRFAEQAKAREHGDLDALEVDEDYVKAMEYGMPPMSGWGMGVDRFLALLTAQDNLKDVVLFPLMRPNE